VQPILRRSQLRVDRCMPPAMLIWNLQTGLLRIRAAFG
jgi:hypothetical protein